MRLVQILRFEWHTGIPDGEMRAARVVEKASLDEADVAAEFASQFFDHGVGVPDITAWERNASGGVRRGVAVAKPLPEEGKPVPTSWRDTLDVQFTVQDALAVGGRHFLLQETKV